MILRDTSSSTDVAERKESRVRSLMKAFSWRLVATLTTSIIAYYVTGQVETAIAIGSIEFFLKFVIYYFHERAWQLLPRGTIRTLFRAE